MQKQWANAMRAGAAAPGAVRAFLRRRWVLWLLALPMLCMAGGAAHALDLQVNHSILYYGNPAINPQDGPVGGSYTYRTSSGVNDASGSVNNAVLLENLPADALFLGINAPAGVNCTGVPAVNTPVGASTISCTIPTLAAGSPTVIDFNVILPAPHITNTGSASLSAPGNTDGNSANDNNIARGITTYERADLAVQITNPANNSTQQQGTVVNYGVQVSNTNSPYAFPLLAGEKAVVRFPLPVGTSWQGSPSSSGNLWSCAQGMDNSATPPVSVQTCEYTAPAGGVAKNTNLPLLTIPVTVTADSGNTDALASVAGLTTGGTSFIDAYPDNNVDQVRINFAPNTQLDMVLNKSVIPSTLDKAGAVSQPVVYTLKSTRNSGLLMPSGAIQITDTLPVNVTYVSVDAAAATAGWACNAVGQALTCNFTGTVNGDASLPDLVYAANVNVGGVTVDGMTGSFTLPNTATLTVANEPVGSTGNNTSTANLIVSNRPSLTTTKAARANATDNTGVGAIADGTEFFWRIGVTNNGQVDVLTSNTITVTDVLDSKLEYVLDVSTEAPWSCSFSGAYPAVQTVTCTLNAGIPHTAPNNVSNLNIKVRAHIPGGQSWATISNQASVSCPTGRDCPTPSILTNTSSVNLSQLMADLYILKDAALTGGPTANASGDEVEYTLRVKNALPLGQNAGDFQMAQTVEVHDVITNLLNTNVNAAAHPVLGTPRYANNRFLEYALVTPFLNGVTGSCDYHTTAPDGTTNLPANQVRVTCTLNNVPVGDDEYVIKIKARQFVNPTSSLDQTRTITNTATVSSPDTAEYTGTNALPNSDDATVTLTARTNLRATKTAAPIAALAGQPVTYSLGAVNEGPSQATAVTMVDTLPVGMIWVTAPNMPTSGANQGTCSLSGGGSFAAGEVVNNTTNTMTCTWTNPASVGTRTLTYTLRSASTGYPASVTNNAQVDTTTAETKPLSHSSTDNKAGQTVTLSPAQLDVRITMEHTADRLPINQGAASRTEYTIRVMNSGNSTSYATNVVMTDVFPAPGSTATFALNGAAVTGVQVIGSNNLPVNPNRFSPSNCAFTAGQLQCSFPWLAPGESAEIKFEMDAMAINNNGLPYGTIRHEASVSADGELLPSLPPGQTVFDNNTVSDRTSAYDAASGFDPADLQFVDLAVTKTSTTNATQVGGQIDYRLTVTNVETAAPPNHLVNGNAVVTDVLPAGLALVGAAPGGCAYAAATRTLTCTITNLNQGASIKFDFIVRVNALAPGQTRVVNRASVNSPGDPNPNNDEGDVEVPSTPPPLSPTSIPTLSEWGLILLSLLLVGVAARRMQRTTARRR